MIRRGFWLLAGAALGVTGYRKATRLARTLTGQGLAGGPAAMRQRPAVRLPAARAGHIARVRSQRMLPGLMLPGELATGQPSSGQPGSAQLASGQPGAGQPASGQPGSVQLANGQPGAGQLASGQPGSVQLANGQPATGKPGAGPAARIAAAAARAAAAAGFVRDVRDGMAEYWDLHRSESDRTLESQRERMWPGDSQPGRREH